MMTGKEPYNREENITDWIAVILIVTLICGTAILITKIL
jgi:hypothetical protein